MSQTAFRELLLAGDVAALQSAWRELMPHLPQPETAEQAEIVMHHARTAAESLPLKARAWSHRWLVERDLPSGLPDRLKPSAERIYPRVVEGVSISVNMRNEWMRPAVVEVRSAMETVVEEAYADRRTEPEFVRGRMMEAKDKAMKQLFGRLQNFN